jgi:hypothetical protein
MKSAHCHLFGRAIIVPRSALSIGRTQYLSNPRNLGALASNENLELVLVDGEKAVD